MDRAVQWLLGWVRIELCGPCPERWFNLCGAHGLVFWQVETVDRHTFRMTLPRHRLAQARTLAQRSLSELTVLAQGGLPALLPRLGKRLGMALGAAAFLLLVTVLGRVVMVVEVEGNETIPDAAIVALLQRCGFGVGSYGPAVDVRDLSNRALMEMDGLSFLTVDLKGIRARVVVREAEPVPELAPTAPADIVAGRDGFLVQVDALSGQPTAQAGDSVLRGETVISHLIRNEKRDGSGEIVSTQVVRARGQVWAVTEHHLSAALPLSALTPAEGAGTGWGALVLGQRVNFCGNTGQRDRKCGKMSVLSRLRLPSGPALPFGWWQVRWRTLAQGPVLSPERGEACLKQALRTRLDRLLAEGQVLGTDWEVRRQAGAVIVTLHARCLEQIGVTVERDAQP